MAYHVNPFAAHPSPRPSVSTFYLFLNSASALIKYVRPTENYLKDRYVKAYH